MYSDSVKKILDKEHIDIGHRVTVKKDNTTYEGLLMPDGKDKDTLVIKLDSGYNIGLHFQNAEIKKADAENAMKKTRERKPMEQDKSKPLVSLIPTGGTITSKIDYETGGVITLMSPEELMEKIPELGKIAQIKIESPFMKMSEDFTSQDWSEIARAVAKELNKGSEGAIVTQGTDTLHYTAAALSFMLDTPKPVLLVGSQRSSDRGSTDSAMNLICAAHLALSDIAEVGTCMHGTINDDFCLFIRGTKVRKMHASRRDAFRPINDTALAKVFPSGNIEILNSQYKKRSDGKAKADTSFEEKIALQKIYPGSDPEILGYIADRYEGVVIEATGFGHVPTHGENSWIQKIKETCERIPVVVATQTIYGRVNTDVYTNLRILFQKTQAIPAEDMHPETAFIKLGFVLGHTKKQEEVRKKMLENLKGEITDRDVNGFLA